jgi:hypothetical protein
MKRQICQRSTGTSSARPLPRSAARQNGGAGIALMKRLVIAESPSTRVAGAASSISGWPMLVAWTYVSCVRSMRLSIISR